MSVNTRSSVDGEGELARVEVEPTDGTTDEFVRAVRRRSDNRTLERLALMYIEAEPEGNASGFYQQVRGRKQDALRAYRKAQERRDG